ncbi:MAG TPA: hypothetical protein VGA69_05485 [Nitriliruptorales bacterium]
MSTPREGTPPARRRGRSVPAIYGVLSLVLVAGALTFALSAPPPSTPPLAEVAPAPQEDIEVERVEQSSRFGEGGGGEGDCELGAQDCEGVGEQPATQPTAQPSVIETAPGAGFRRCYGTPPDQRQTEDPQSPPCISEVWSGNNGGATASGVTATGIRVAVPWRDRDDAAVRPAIEAFARHFNQHYELHGRSIELVFVVPSANTSGAEGRRAWARDLLAVEPFAALEPATGSSGEAAYYRTLDDAGIVATVGDVAQASASLPSLDAYSNVWSLFPTTNEALRTSGEVVCRAFVGRRASHGGDDVRQRTRRFGVLQLDQHGERVDASPLTSRLDACQAPYGTYTATMSDDESIEAALRSMRGDEVTTVICACSSLEDNVPQAADRLAWEPEWFHPATNDHTFSNGTTRGFNTAPPAQVKHMFGITAQLRRPEATTGAERERHEEQYWYHALQREAPGSQFDGGTRSRRMYSYYAQLLILASGIQWAAGPELTPATFRDALEELGYPNPRVGQAPWFQPSVSFGPADHVFNSDYAVFWWDAPEVDDSTHVKNGRMCYVGGGTRYETGTFPEDLDDRLFDPEAGCR